MPATDLAPASTGCSPLWFFPIVGSMRSGRGRKFPAAWSESDRERSGGGAEESRGQQSLLPMCADPVNRDRICTQPSIAPATFSHIRI